MKTLFIIFTLISSNLAHSLVDYAEYHRPTYRDTAGGIPDLNIKILDKALSINEINSVYKKCLLNSNGGLIFNLSKKIEPLIKKSITEKLEIETHFNSYEVHGSDYFSFKNNRFSILSPESNAYITLEVFLPTLSIEESNEIVNELGEYKYITNLKISYPETFYGEKVPLYNPDTRLFSKTLFVNTKAYAECLVTEAKNFGKK